MRNLNCDGVIDTYCNVSGVECAVLVHYDYQPAEPDVNVGEGVEVTAAYFEDEGCVLDDMTEGEVHELEQRILEGLSGGDYDAYCDHKYDQMVDRRLDND